MIPADAWPTYHMRKTTQRADVESSGQNDAAQLLQQQYGHLLSKDAKRK